MSEPVDRSTDPRINFDETYPGLPDPRITSHEIAAWIFTAGALLLIFYQRLVPAVLAGLAFYLLLNKTASYLSGRIHGRAVRPLSILAAVVIGTAAVAGASALVFSIVRAQMTNIPALMKKMAQVLESTRVWLMGVGGYELFPEALKDADDLKVLVADWLKEHAEAIGSLGESFSMAIAHTIMAILLAAMVFLRHRRKDAALPTNGPLGFYLRQKVQRFSRAFAQVVSAQVKISAINTVLTGLYLLILLPLFARSLPFTMTIIFITFVCGLIPVLGNLISNSVIVVVSLGVSPAVAIASLLFLVAIHKLEYIVNSRIVGNKTDSEIWEILLAILIGEVLFGVQGIVMAPIIYTFIKRELIHKKLV